MKFERARASLSKKIPGRDKPVYEPVGGFIVPEPVADLMREHGWSIGFSPAWLPDVTYWGRFFADNDDDQEQTTKSKY